ncbi:cobalt-precorrin-5B (C(1))-methyltransferase [Desulfovibrio ferrophilus]|uniref:Cobalt-precorrin-5B C(1)-methyltransferase n=1 Tax=Desulfovibrio ferrophilus TaxID=241368 RepID=A0A2Z6B2H9_9BACT|nr:cobalt-precorrin-5B (C(1))-methyltransferase [Desulfovibrio ferrophilus]BBD09702.1 putative cobalt-precorrin-6A synthase [deacetylating] [Desulfovibrio ferrophilus]
MCPELREGFTTGTAAAAAAKAATLFLLTGQQAKTMDTPLPPGGRLTVPVADITRESPRTARATVIKDGGDDPDATHGHTIEVLVELRPDVDLPPQILGGKGVGTVTLPGLPVPPGEPAINPEPRKQIATAVTEAITSQDFQGSVRVTVEVPAGETIAQKTMNPRLGIVGGISILGTRGTVKPFSHESYAASIKQALDVALAQGTTHIGLSTGGRTEGLLRADLPNLPETAFIQFADFFALALSEAGARGFSEITVGCYFGKLVKMAMGFEYTHAKDTRIDFDRLSHWCRKAGLDANRAAQAKEAITARHVLEIVLEDPAKDAIVGSIAKKALTVARGFAGATPRISYRVYGFDGAPLTHLTGEE